MIESQIGLHRFEAVMRCAGWVARRYGPPLRSHPVAAGPNPHLERYAGALRFPMGLQD